MAIKLRVQDNTVKLNAYGGDGARFRVDGLVQVISGGDIYEGPYRVTPTQDTQTLQTLNLMMSNNVTIDPIPSNYGLITWDGAILTVS